MTPAFHSSVQIAGREVGPGAPTFVVAEAGVNHNGDFDLACQLVDAAAAAGADAVKFQAFRTEHLILVDVAKAPYQQATTGTSETQFEMLKKLELSRAQTRRLQAYCAEQEILFLTTPFDEVSLDELDALDLPAYKVASTDLTNVAFLRRIAAKGKPMLLSTGMSHMGEVERALEVVGAVNPQVVLLQCTANYPIADDEAHLRVITTYRERFSGPAGFSDHSVGIGAGPYAVALGACLVEKHFTLSRALDGPDQRASLEPDELAAFVREIRKVERMLGSARKTVTLSETQTRAALQKHLVARRPIRAGEPFSADNLTAKRTGGEGLSAQYVDDLIGRPADRDYQADEIIRL